MSKPPQPTTPSRAKKKGRVRTRPVAVLPCWCRLQQELMGIMMGEDPGASAFPNDDNLFEWTATLCGSEDTVVSAEHASSRRGRLFEVCLLQTWQGLWLLSLI